MSDDIETKVKELLAAIEEEKRKPKPSKRIMRQCFNEIVRLKEDWRITDTGQDNRFVPQSTREWDDDEPNPKPLKLAP